MSEPSPTSDTRSSSTPSGIPQHYPVGQSGGEEEGTDGKLVKDNDVTPTRPGSDEGREKGANHRGRKGADERETAPGTTPEHGEATPSRSSPRQNQDGGTTPSRSSPQQIQHGETTPSPSSPQQNQDGETTPSRSSPQQNQDGETTPSRSSPQHNQLLEGGTLGESTSSRLSHSNGVLTSSELELSDKQPRPGDKCEDDRSLHHHHQQQYRSLDGDGDGGGGFCRCLPLRYIIVWTVFVGMVIVNAMRTNVAVTVVTILNKEHHAVRNETGEIRELPSVSWNTLEIGYLHSIFYLGYMITQLPAGYLTTRLPSHKLFSLCILTSCLLNLTLPVIIELGGYMLTMVVRFVQGFSEGFLYPACYGILRHWSTPVERGRLGSLVLTGAYLGPVVGFPMAGLITDYMGWPYIYYVNGGIGVVFVMVWAWLSEEKPAHHKKISNDELTLIEDLQGSERIDYEGARIPWLAILTSLPVMSLCLCNFARNWVFILMLTNEPFFLDMFHFSLALNGAMSAIPHVFKMSASLTSGQLADCLIAKELMSTTSIRKLLTGGFGLQAVFFILLAQTTDRTVAMVLLTLAIGFGGFVVSGWQLNHYDLSARYASVLVAVSSTFGNIGSVAAPILAGLLTDGKTFYGWNQLFYITSGIVGMACLSFLVFGSGERQYWSLPPDTSHLVVKEDKRRRAHLANSKASGAKVKATSPDPCPQPAFTFSKLREEDKDNGNATSSHMPNYGSGDHTSVSARGVEQ